ncbi:unnamed protein product [Phytomonas sp. EM1]|nr:unnamed protein product [Phytomonas sp. EM1]|eukprot:CCW61951.1 unnamed protein product [Phytomonas sp. isolate EM1]
MIQLEGVLLFALDVVKGPYVHCGAPYNPFAGYDADDHATSRHLNPANNTSTSSVRIFQDDDTGVLSEGNFAVDRMQGGTSEALFSSAAISMESTHGATTTATFTGDRGIRGLIDLFVPRSEFCHRVLWLHPAESGFFYLYYPEEIPGEHYQRKTLRYSLCFMFQVDSHWMTIGESLIRRLVKPYSMMLRNVAEKLRYAEVKYGYISRALTVTNAFPSGHFNDEHTEVSPPTSAMTRNNALSNCANEEENYAPSSSECGKNTSMTGMKSTFSGSNLTTANMQHPTTTRNPFVPFSSFNYPCVTSTLPSQSAVTPEEVASYAANVKDGAIPCEAKPIAPPTLFSVSSTLEKTLDTFGDIPEEAVGIPADGAIVEGGRKGPDDEEEATSRTTVATGAVPQNNLEDPTPHPSHFPTLTSSSGLSSEYIPPDMLYRQLWTSGTFTSTFSPTAVPAVAAATLYPVINCFITPLVEHRWTPLGEFIEGLYHVLRKADLEEATVGKNAFEADSALEAAERRQAVGVPLDREHTWVQPNMEPSASMLSTTKVMARVVVSSPLKLSREGGGMHLMGAGNKAGEMVKQLGGITTKVNCGSVSAAFVDRCAKRIERRAATLATRLREKKVYDPKSVYLSNNLDIRISRIAPLKVAETIRLDQVPIPIVSYSAEKMEVFERMDLFVHEALKLVDGCRTVAAIAFILSMKMSAQLKEFYSTAVQSVASSAARAAITSSNRKHAFQSEQTKRRSGVHGGVANSTSLGNGLEVSSAPFCQTSKGLNHNLSTHVLVSVFHYAPANGSAAFASNSLATGHSKKRNSSGNCPPNGIAHNQSVPSMVKQRHPPDMLLNVLERGTINVLNPNVPALSSLASETSMVIELPANWKVVLNALVEALLHLQMCNFVRLLDLWSPHTCFQVTERFYEILTNHKHPAREAIGSYMLQATDQVRFARRKMARGPGAQKSGSKRQGKVRCNSKDRAEHTDTPEGLSSQGQIHRTGTVQNPPKSSSSGHGRKSRSDEVHEAKGSPHFSETYRALKSHDSLSSTTPTTTTSLLIVKKQQDMEMGKKASSLKSALPLGEDGTGELNWQNNPSITAAGTSASPASTFCNTFPPPFLLTRLHSQQVRGATTERHANYADPHATAPVIVSTATNNRHSRVGSGGRGGFAPGMAMSPLTLPTTLSSQSPSTHTQRGATLDPSSPSHTSSPASIALSLGIGVGTEARSNRWYLTLSAVPLSAHLALRTSASIPLSVPAVPGEDTTPTSKYAFPTSWSSHEGKFSDLMIARSGKADFIGGSIREPIADDGVDSSESFISSTSSSEMLSDLSSLSSSTMASLHVPDTMAPTNSDAASFVAAEATVHRKASHHLEVPKSCPPPVAPSSLGRYTTSHTETEISLAASAALCALGKFQHNTVEAVQLEMRWLPAWSGAFAGWATPCCWALVELATLNGWLEKVFV